MFLLLIFVFLGSVGANAPEKLPWSASKFVFNGQPGEYIKTKLGSADSLKSWAKTQRDYNSYYSDPQLLLLSLGAWIKPEHHVDNTVQHILEFDRQYQVVVVNGTLGYVRWDEWTGNATSAICPGDYDLNEWNYLFLQVKHESYYERRRKMVVTLSLRPLDRTTPFKNLDCREFEFERENSTQNTSEIWAGRGYVGQMTPVSIDWYKDNDQFTRMKKCLVTDDATTCRERTGRHHHQDPHVQPILDPGMTIRREVDTEVRVLFNTVYECKDKTVSLALNAAHFGLPEPTTNRVRYYDRGWGGYRYKYVTSFPVNVTLGEGDAACNLTWYTEDRMFKIGPGPVPLTSCGFQARQMDNSTTLYHNTLYVTRATGGRQELLDVGCWYQPQEELVEEVALAAYAVQRLQLSTTHTTNPWVMSLGLYGDGNFTQRLENPVLLLQEQEVYVEGNVTHNVSLEIESCKSRVSLSQHVTLEKVLIEGALPVAPDVRLLNSTSPSRKRFVFKTTVFEEYPNAVVYLSCVMKAKEIPKE